jgi:hypothetical protein
MALEKVEPGSVVVKAELNDEVKTVDIVVTVVPVVPERTVVVEKVEVRTVVLMITPGMVCMLIELVVFLDGLLVVVSGPFRNPPSLLDDDVTSPAPPFRLPESSIEDVEDTSAFDVEIELVVFGGSDVVLVYPALFFEVLEVVPWLPKPIKISSDTDVVLEEGAAFFSFPWRSELVVPTKSVEVDEASTFGDADDNETKDDEREDEEARPLAAPLPPTSLVVIIGFNSEVVYSDEDTNVGDSVGLGGESTGTLDVVVMITMEELGGVVCEVTVSMAFSGL